MLPFAVRRVDIAAPCATEMWAVVATAGDGLDIALCDQDGRVCVRLSGFRTRPVEAAAPRLPGSVVEAPAGELHGQVRAALRQMVSALIKVNPTDIDLDSELSEYGFDSISLTELANRLNSEFDLDLMPTLFFEFPTIVALVWPGSASRVSVAGCPKAILATSIWFSSARTIRVFKSPMVRSARPSKVC